MNLKTGALLLSVSLMVLLATGCDREKWEMDKKIQEEVFFKYLKHLPAGPLAAKYNDWDEVVSECGVQARHIAYRCMKNCK